MADNPPVSGSVQVLIGQIHTLRRLFAAFLQGLVYRGNRIKVVLSLASDIIDSSIKALKFPSNFSSSMYLLSKSSNGIICGIPHFHQCPGFLGIRQHQA